MEMQQQMKVSHLFQQILDYSLFNLTGTSTRIGRVSKNKEQGDAGQQEIKERNNTD